MPDGAGADVAVEATQEVTRAWKGFDAAFSCRGHAFEVGKTYTLDGEAIICERGYHACLHPLDVLGYYGARKSRFAEVEMIGGLVREKGGDSKVAATAIRIVREIGYADLWRAHREWLSMQEIASSATGPFGHASATGPAGHASATGPAGHASATGPFGHASATGDSGHASATGHFGHASATGKSSIAIAVGKRATATASAGGWIVLAQYAKDGSLVAVKTGRCGDGGLAPGTYRLDDAGAFAPIEKETMEDAS